MADWQARPKGGTPEWVIRTVLRIYCKDAGIKFTYGNMSAIDTGKHNERIKILLQEAQPILAENAALKEKVKILKRDQILVLQEGQGIVCKKCGEALKQEAPDG